MELESKCILVLAGKSATEKELANSMKASNILKLPDIEDVSVLLHSESRNDESFRVNSYMNSLSTKCFGRFFIWSPRLPSTHDVVSKNFGELPVGSVCVADLQYKGRGRSMNVWESPKGCLLFSFTIQIEDGKILPLVQYVVSLAMTEALHDVCTKDGVPYLDVKIKWPNDLYIDGLKVGGILCTSTYRSKTFNVSAGLGLNVDNEKPTTSLNAVLRKLTSDSYQLQREDIISAFFNKFEIFFNLFMDQGFKPLEELYYKTWLHSGQRVIVEEKNDDKDQGRQSVVTVQGLTSSGYLLAVGDDNQMCELHPDGNRFTPLSADGDLEFGNVYIMFPMRRLKSVATADDMARLFMVANPIATNISGASNNKVRVLPESAPVASPGSETEGSGEFSFEEIEGFYTGEFKYRLSMSRSRKPLLDTITEEPVSSR